MHTVRRCLLALFVAHATGCSSSGWNPTSGLEASAKPVSTTESPAAIVAGAPVDRAELFPVLAEIAGAAALREVALDREISRELARRGIAVGDAEIDAERERLLATFGAGEEGQEVVRRVLESRALGPHRLGLLLRRNASLRALIEAPGAASDDAVRVAFEVRHGAKRRVRLALIGSSRDAARARSAILERSGEAGVAAAFAEIAAERSIDSTASVGGLLGDISTADPGLSDVLRREIARAEPGRVGDIVALDAGFALVLVEADVPADGTTIESVRDDLVAEIRDRTERLAMESLADELIERAGVTPLAPGLRWSWQLEARAEANR